MTRYTSVTCPISSVSCFHVNGLCSTLFYATIVAGLYFAEYGKSQDGYWDDFNFQPYAGCIHIY